LGATTIVAIYKDRWQIELFFKALEQNLKIKTFVGTSANAVKIQIWTSMDSHADSSLPDAMK
jgi:IS4 transposase